MKYMTYGEIQAKRDELFAQVTQAETALQAAQKDLQDFDEGLADAKICFKGDPCYDEEAKPAPKGKATKAKPKAKKTAKATAKATAKVAKAKSGKPVTVTAESKKNARQGRDAVARGDRPPLKKAIAQVMGTRVLNTKGVIAALDAKGWLPASTNPHQYISYMLSSNCPEVFERTERRGFYRVRPGAKLQDKAAAPKKSNGSSKKAAPKAKAKKQKKAAKADPKIDASLEASYGTDIVNGNVEDDPFGDLTTSV